MGRDLDARVLAQTARTYGVIERGRALELGASPSLIKRRLRSGRWLRLFPSVYLIGQPEPSPEARTLGACLACGTEAVASHRTSAEVWGFLEPVGGDPIVTVPASRRPRIPGIVAHRTTVLPASERTRYRNIPVTPPMRTLLDLSQEAEPMELEHAVDEALRRRSVDLGRFSAYLRRPRALRAPGSDLLRQVVADRFEGVPMSVLETETLALLRWYRLPMPTRQHRGSTGSGRAKIDFTYPEQRIAIEVDGHASHSSRAARQADLHRQNGIVVGGWTVLRFTWWDVTQDADYVAFTIARVLGIRPARWGPAPKGSIPSRGLR